MRLDQGRKMIPQPFHSYSRQSQRYHTGCVAYTNYSFHINTRQTEYQQDGSRFTGAYANDRLHSDLPSILVLTSYFHFLAAQPTQALISLFFFRGLLRMFFNAFSIIPWHFNKCFNLTVWETKQATKHKSERDGVCFLVAECSCTIGTPAVLTPGLLSCSALRHSSESDTVTVSFGRGETLRQFTDKP